MASRTSLVLESDVLKFLDDILCNPQVVSRHGIDRAREQLGNLLHRLSMPPVFTTLRINTSAATREQAKQQLQRHLDQIHKAKDEKPLRVEEHSSLPDVLVVPHTGPLKLDKTKQQVIVDLACGMAVLRGAHVFAQGIMAAPSYMSVGDRVSVYADFNGHCRKGLVKPFEGQTVFVGNGIARISRHNIFCNSEKVSGIGVEMTDPVYRAPSLSDVLPHLIFPQNLPSIVCTHVLDPQSGQRVLDMCAAPGGKTTHIAALMQNKGAVIALDKGARKVERVLANADKWGLSCIQAFSHNATKTFDPDSSTDGPPPYPACSFDRVLLDAPCSALGQRPNCRNKMSLKELMSYPKYQKQFFSQAVALLRPGGVLVYSTCTVTLEENEGMVAWALDQFPCLTLGQQEPLVGGPGMLGSSLTNDQLALLQRFDPGRITSDMTMTPDNDTIGFFIAKFIKQATS